jgi:hypothetical protein
MKGIFVVLLLAVGNLIGHAFWTRPLLGERRSAESRRDELEEHLEAQRAEYGQWQRLEKLLERVEPLLDTSNRLDGGSPEFARLRNGFLEAEKGLRLLRGSLDLRPADRAPQGFRGVRIHMTAAGDFENLVRYLDRVSRVRAPIAPIEISLVENRLDQAPLSLNATWYALWPEERSP